MNEELKNWRLFIIAAVAVISVVIASFTIYNIDVNRNIAEAESCVTKVLLGSPYRDITASLLICRLGITNLDDSAK